jgi:hypothetical protein
VTADLSVSATFAIDTYTLGYAAGAHGAITGAAAQTVDYGHDGSAVTAVPDTGYHFVAWSDGVLTATRTDAGVTADLSVTATFAIDTHAIDASAGAHGTISPSSTQAVDYGADQTYDISADAHYHIADVLVDGVSVGAVSSYTFTGVTGAHTISAGFTVDTNLISASAGPHGWITPSGTRAVDYGAHQTYLMSADAHYRIADVLIDGASVGAVSSYTFSGVTAGHTIAVTFAPTDPPLTSVKGLPSSWVGRTVKLSLVAVHTVDGAPVAYTEYRVGSGPWVRGTSVVVKRQGVTLVTYRSVDTVGNVEVAKTCGVRIDTTAPVVVVGNEVNVNRGDVASFPYRLRDNLAKSLDCRLVITWHGKVVAVKRLGQRPVGRSLVVKMRCTLAVHGADAYGWRIEAGDAAGNRAAATGGELEVWVHWFGADRH